MTNINKTHSLFGGRGERVTTYEMHCIYDEFFYAFKKEGVVSALTRPLPSKETHGDIDIVLSPTKNKVVAFPKETMNDLVYGA